MISCVITATNSNILTVFRSNTKLRELNLSCAKLELNRENTKCFKQYNGQTVRRSEVLYQMGRTKYKVWQKSMQVERWTNKLCSF